MRPYDLAKELLAIGAIQIKTSDYFTWTSGIQSPIYCDNRLTMSYPSIRDAIATHFMTSIEAMEEQPDVIAGCATAGIPHAAWLSEKLDLPMIYVRSKPKGHGKGNQIEGSYKKGQHVLVIEDLISTGMSSIDAANALRQEGLHVLGVSAIFTYGLKQAHQQFQQESLTYQAIMSFDDILHHLLKEGRISNSEESELLAWRNQL